MKTAGVKKLVLEALDSLPQPHTEDVIDEVFCAIEHHAPWRAQYDELCNELGQTVVNTWGGFYISSAEGGQSVRQVPAVKSRLVQSYSKLAPSHRRSQRKPSEGNARQLMSSYYLQHKASLPASIRERREYIIDLIVEGASPEEAFALAVTDLK
jgi:hypothetical protein